MPEVRPPTLSMEHWDRSAKKKRNFCDWLRRFDNWLALQDALLPDTQKLPAQVKCWSLIQHLGADGRNRLCAVFAGKIPGQLDTDYESLHAILSSIFAESPNLQIARLFGRKQDASKRLWTAPRPCKCWLNIAILGRWKTTCSQVDCAMAAPA